MECCNAQRSDSNFWKIPVVGLLGGAMFHGMKAGFTVTRVALAWWNVFRSSREDKALHGEVVREAKTMTRNLRNQAGITALCTGTLFAMRAFQKDFLG